MSALDEKIRHEVESAIRAERRRTRELLGEVLAEMERRFDAKLSRADNALDRLNGDVHELFGRQPDANGIIRRQFFTPRPDRHG
jgi:hypothetical protein